VSGILTARDGLAIQFDRELAKQAIAEFCSSDIPDAVVAERYGLDDNYAWKISEVRNAAAGEAITFNRLESISYRPFDQRVIIYDPRIVFRTRAEIMANMTGDGNLALGTVRGIEIQRGWEHAFAFGGLIQHHSVSLKEVNYLFPLWLLDDHLPSERRANIDERSLQQICTRTGFSYLGGTHPTREPVSSRGTGDLQTTFGPRDVFDWGYAILYSPTYRSRYAELLKSDFPRIPITSDRKLFRTLVQLGHELAALHLLRSDEAPNLADPLIRFAGRGGARVEKGFPRYENGKVMINASRWFEDVPRATWEFHVGGYQVCEKWLKDRAGKGGKNPSLGRVLTDDDILHYRRVVVALTETRRLMAEIDAAIEAHGGWPGAFKIDSESAAPVSVQ
jgi:predicted helicase